MLLQVVSTRTASTSRRLQAATHRKLHTLTPPPRPNNKSFSVNACHHIQLAAQILSQTNILTYVIICRLFITCHPIKKIYLKQLLIKVPANQGTSSAYYFVVLVLVLVLVVVVAVGVVTAALEIFLLISRHFIQVPLAFH